MELPEKSHDAKKALDDIYKSTYASVMSRRGQEPLPVYGIWNGRGWMRTSDGVFQQSWSPNALKAQMMDWSEELRGVAVVCEIGPDGLPMAVTP